MVVVNLFAPPGSGKSTLAAGVFSELKLRNISCELVTEYAKDLVWDNSLDVLKDQIYIFAEQLHRLKRLRNHKLEFVIVDSPLPLSVFYGEHESEVFRKLVMEEFSKFINVNFWVNRTKPYNPTGRLQTEEESDSIKPHIIEIMKAYHMEEVTGNRDGINKILEVLL
jgi:GTPase SAR1 family protein